MILLTTSITNSLKIESKHDVIPYEGKYVYSNFNNIILNI